MDAQRNFNEKYLSALVRVLGLSEDQQQHHILSTTFLFNLRVE